MTTLLIVLGALIAVLVASELVLGSTKLQTGLSRVLVAWTLVYLPTCYLLLRYGDAGLIAYTIFWGGAFLSWFGVRSHIESSILLRMLYLLRRQPLSDAEILAKYGSHYGENMRIEELLRGGLAEKSGDRLVVTPKGRGILGVVAKLR
jgi:hypothetical protein